MGNTVTTTPAALEPKVRQDGEILSGRLKHSMIDDLYDVKLIGHGNINSSSYFLKAIAKLTSKKKGG